MNMKIIDKKEYSANTLKRIDEWITNCDLKTSILMAFITVIVTFIFTSEHILKTMELIFKDFFVFCKEHIGEFDLKRLLIIGFLITAYVFFIRGLYAIYRVLKAKTNSSNITKQNGLLSNSVLFFKYIQTINYLEYKNEIENKTEEQLIDDYLSQIYINSVRAEEKFNYYNKALKNILIGLIFLFSFVLLIVVENS